MQYIVDDTCIYFSWGNNDELTLMMDAIEKKEINKLIIFGPQEHTIIRFDNSPVDAKMFDDYMKSKNIDVTRVVGVAPSKKWNPNYRLSYDKKTYGWDTYFAHATVLESFNSNRSPLGHTNIKKSFISLNRRAHPHRCEFIDILHKHKLQEHGIITWHKFETYEYYYKFKYWDPVILKIDEPFDIEKNHQLLVPPLQFQETLFSVICESTSDSIFLTEKTYVPIIHKRPFLLVGAKNIHGYLKKLKFKLFDEIIDYSFDSVDDQTERYNMIMIELAKICNHDPNDLLKILKPKIDYNYVNLLNIFKNSIGADPEVVKIVNQYSGPMELYKDLLNYGKTPNFEKFYNKMIQGITL